ncbi:hypothetical protein Tco_1540545 [Tanacetum coccineum]
MNVTMVDEEADSNPTRDIRELERLLAKDPHSYFVEIQVHSVITKPEPFFHTQPISPLYGMFVSYKSSTKPYKVDREMKSPSTFSKVLAVTPNLTCPSAVVPADSSSSVPADYVSAGHEEIDVYLLRLPLLTLLWILPLLRHPGSAIDDPRPAAGSFSMADVRRLRAHVIKLRDMPEEMEMSFPFIVTVPAAADYCYSESFSLNFTAGTLVLRETRVGACLSRRLSILKVRAFGDDATAPLLVTCGSTVGVGCSYRPTFRVLTKEVFKDPAVYKTVVKGYEVKHGVVYRYWNKDDFAGMLNKMANFMPELSTNVVPASSTISFEQMEERVNAVVGWDDGLVTLFVVVRRGAANSFGV